ncbi:MAG: tetratricopeptide repeat protein [Sulfurimonadaceae bacterium]|nr:tetratricopeptide repeat protein [Sulfurimonadaceae bacterium]
MTLFQLLMLGASAFFAYKIYEHIQTLKDEQNENKDEAPRSAETFSVFSPESLLIRADEAYEAEDYSKALALLTEAHAKDKNNIEIVFKRAHMLHKVGELDDAVEGFKEALALDEVAFIHNALASVYREKGEFVSARMQLNASLDKDDTNPATYFNYGNLLVDMKNNLEAIQMYEKALEIDPELQAAKDELEKLKVE